MGLLPESAFGDEFKCKGFLLPIDTVLVHQFRLVTGTVQYQVPGNEYSNERRRVDEQITRKTKLYSAIVRSLVLQ